MPNRIDTLELIKVMQAFAAGKTIQVKPYPLTRSEWYTLKPDETPNWDWERNTYRVEPLVKPSIDWTQIPTRYRWLTVDRTGVAYIYENEPTIPPDNTKAWALSGGVYARVDNVHTSFNRGTVDWRDSLVERV